MALRKRKLKDDLLWLRGPFIVLGIAILSAAGMYYGANLFRGEFQQQEMAVQSDFDLLTQQVEEIEQAERIIVENIETYNGMRTNGILDEEDRVALLEDIAAIRSRYQLFPIQVEIREQDRILLEYPPDVAFPDDQVSLRASQVEISLPLLHEGDLMRFLNDFLGTGRLLVTDECSIAEALREVSDELEVVAHQVATCNFYWYTLRLEPFSGV